MERLTKRYIDEDDGRKSIGAYTGYTIPEIWFEGEREYRVLDKLATYEDLEEQGLLMRLPCKVKDTIWELCLCSDGNYRIFPMIVKSISKYGTLRQVEKGTTIWHIYAESDYTYVYKNFTDLGKTVFLTREEAEKKLEEMNKNG